MDPTTVSPPGNWTDLIGAVIIGPIVHGIVTVGSKFQFMQNENLAKGTGILLCFVFMWLFAKWFHAVTTPQELVLAGLAAWGAASSAKLAKSVGTNVVRSGSAPPTP